MTKQRVHIALAVKDLDKSIEDYTKKLGVGPCWKADNQYALFRTDLLNLSISQDPKNAGNIRHLGFEDENSQSFTKELDADGVEWEKFSKVVQEKEILEFYPNAKRL